MAAITKGQVLHLYGIADTLTDVKLQSISFDEDFQNTSEVLNEQGRRVEVRMDDIKKSGSMEFIPEADYVANTYVMGANFEFGGDTYWITKISRKQGNKEHRKWTVTFENSEYVDLTP